MSDDTTTEKILVALAVEATKFTVKQLAEGASKLWTRVKTAAFPTCAHEELYEKLKNQPMEVKTEVDRVATTDDEFKQDIVKYIQQINLDHSQIGGFFNAPVTIMGNVYFGQTETTESQASPDRPLHIHNLTQRNRFFTGRDDLLKKVNANLNADQATALTALKGLGGIGKTQIALEYAHKYEQDYDLIWWVRSEKEEERVASFSALAARLNLPETAAQDANITRDAVKAWLLNPVPQGVRWLMIFDNATTLKELTPYLPSGGHVLITSREPEWDTIKLIDVDYFTDEEAVEFVLKRSEDNDKESATALSKELGNLPLALEQAAAYVKRSPRISLKEYLKLFKEKRHEMFQGKRAKASQYEKTVETCWEMTFERVREFEAAAQFFNSIAFLAPDNIPEDIFRSAGEHLPEPLRNFVADDKEWEDNVISPLLDYSLISSTEKGIVSVHRIVHKVTRDRQSNKERKTNAAAAAEIVNLSFPYVELKTWPLCDILLPHGLASSGYSETTKIALAATSRLLNQCGSYLIERARYEEAKDCFERAIRIGEAEYGKYHPEVAICVNNLGVVLRRMGDLEGAMKCSEWAIGIGEAEHGKDHPQVAKYVNNLGSVLWEVGDLRGAKKCFERAIRIDETEFGKDSPEVARDMNNLGLTLRTMGSLKDAKKCYERSIRIKVNHPDMGPRHPSTANSIFNLGIVKESEGDLQGALDNYKETLRVFKIHLNEDHPHIINVKKFIERVRRKL